VVKIFLLINNNSLPTLIDVKSSNYKPYIVVLSILGSILILEYFGVVTFFFLGCLGFILYYIKYNWHDFFKRSEITSNNIYITKLSSCTHGTIINEMYRCQKCEDSLDRYAYKYDTSSIFNKTFYFSFGLFPWVIYLAIVLFGQAWVRTFITCVVFAIIGFIAAIIHKIRDSKEYRKSLNRKCSHNITGAAYIPGLCNQCVEDKKRRDIQIKIEQDQKKIQQELDRKKAYEDWVQKIRLPEYLKTVDPQDFEKIVCQLFAKMGYKVEGTRYSGDNGSDGFLYKENSKTVLQCKRVKGSVGEPILRDLYGTMHATQCNDAIVVTTGTVSRQAREWITGKPIRIIELEELNQLFKKYFNENEVVPDTFTVNGFVELDECPKCRSKLRIRVGRRGKFMGCSSYPKCSYTSNIN
jgi:restriction system protein